MSRLEDTIVEVLFVGGYFLIIAQGCNIIAKVFRRNERTITTMDTWYVYVIGGFSTLVAYTPYLNLLAVPAAIGGILVAGVCIITHGRKVVLRESIGIVFNITACALAVYEERTFSLYPLFG